MPECHKIKKGELDRDGPEHFGGLIFATVRKSLELKGLNCVRLFIYSQRNCNIKTKGQK